MHVQGLKGKAVKEEADCMIEDLQLQDKSDVPSSNLSGGMKRKLRCHSRLDIIGQNIQHVSYRKEGHNYTQCIH